MYDSQLGVRSNQVRQGSGLYKQGSVKLSCSLQGHCRRQVAHCMASRIASNFCPPDELTPYSPHFFKDVHADGGTRVPDLLLLSCRPCLYPRHMTERSCWGQCLVLTDLKLRQCDVYVVQVHLIVQRLALAWEILHLLALPAHKRPPLCGGSHCMHSFGGSQPKRMQRVLRILRQVSMRGRKVSQQASSGLQAYPVCLLACVSVFACRELQRATITKHGGAQQALHEGWCAVLPWACNLISEAGALCLGCWLGPTDPRTSPNKSTRAAQPISLCPYF